MVREKYMNWTNDIPVGTNHILISKPNTEYKSPCKISSGRGERERESTIELSTKFQHRGISLTDLNTSDLNVQETF